MATLEELMATASRTVDGDRMHRSAVEHEGETYVGFGNTVEEADMFLSEQLEFYLGLPDETTAWAKELSLIHI